MKKNRKPIADWLKSKDHKRAYIASNTQLNVTETVLSTLQCDPATYE